MMAYDEVTQAVKERIKALIPDHPEILNITSPYELVFVKGFDIRDLDASLSQVVFGFRQAVEEYKREQEALS